METACPSIENLAGRDEHAKHFLKTDRLSTELDAVGIVRLGSAPLVLNRDGATMRTASGIGFPSHNVGDADEPQLGAVDRQCPRDATPWPGF